MLSILPKDLFHLLLCLKQPALLLQFSPSFSPNPNLPPCQPSSQSKRRNLSLESIESSFFFPFTSFISLHLWAHSLEGKGARLMGPSPLRDFALLLFCFSFCLLCFFTGRICNEGKEQNRKTRILIKGLGDLSMNKLMQGGSTQHKMASS